MASLDKNGREILDQTPVSVPIKFNRPEPIHQRIRRMIQAAVQQPPEGYETFADADDFDVEDEPGEFKGFYEEPDYLGPLSPPAPTPAPAPEKGSGGAEPSPADPNPVSSS